MKKWLIIAFLLVFVFLAHGLVSWDGSAPTSHWQRAPSTVGRDTRIVLRIEDEGKGLEWVEVSLEKAGSTRVLLSESYSRPWPWQGGVNWRSLAFSPSLSLGDEQLSEGEFSLRVSLRDHPNFWLWNHPVSEARSFYLDLTPPAIEVLSQQHYIRQGGAESVLYRLSSDAVSSGVQVGENVFDGYPLLEPGEAAHLCLFALSHDQPADTRMSLWAEDAAGNRSQASFWVKAFPVRFRSRQIRLSDQLMTTVVPEILEHSDDVARQDTVLETFLLVNGKLRQANHAALKAISRKSSRRLLWGEAFLQLSNSQVESAFADHRTYYYDGQEVDQQTHLGFDLASIARSPVESANDGTVVLADYFGIYGNTVLVDHGLGLLSLYGHLSSIDVQAGQSVQRGEVLGRTGQTGLAAGDHLHFSLILQGVQVNPLEWWDARWVNDHILVKSHGGG